MNTLVFGFNKKIYRDLIKEIEEEGLINVKKHFLVSDAPYEENQIDFHSFSGKDDFYTRYFDLIQQYVEGVQFDEEVYKKVYHNIYHYMNSEARMEKKGIKPLHYYLNKFNLLYKFIYALFIKEKIELCLMGNLDHVGVDTIVYEVAKALNVKTLVIETCSIPGNYYKIFYLKGREDYGEFSLMNKIYDTTYHKIVKRSAKDYFYMKLFKCFEPQKPTVKEVINTLIQIIKYGIFKRKNISKIYQSAKLLKYFDLFLGQKYMNNLKKYTREVDYKKNYVYFAMQLQPEMTTSALGGIYCDQILALERLSELIPEDWVIYAKENPAQTNQMREQQFFERLKHLKKVKLVSKNENSLKLVLNSQIVSTITGTVGFEAICEGKPVIIFGNAWYQNFEGVFRFNKDLDFSSVINYKINQEKLEKDYNNLLQRMPNACINPTYWQAIPDFNEQESKDNIKDVIRNIVTQYKNEIGCNV